MSGTKDSIEADLNSHFAKHEDQLWDEEKSENIAKVVEVKRISTKAFDKHSWKIMENKEVVLIIESGNLSKKQIDFLLTPFGIKTLIQKYKDGNNTSTKIKKNLLKVEK